MKKILIIHFVLLGCLCSAFSQVNFLFIPEVAGRSIDGLGNLKLQNLTGTAKRGFVVITVSETTTRQKILSIETPEINLSAGNNSLPVTVYKGSRFNFATNNYAAIVNQTRSFPPGYYNYCFQFISADKNEEYENCYDAEILPLVPITLISPADRDQICQKRPVLTWQPPLPFHPSMRFRLLLTEKVNGSSVESLMMNTPLLLLDNISGTTINYPASRPELKEGKTYCWQVIAFQQGVLVSRSEIWEFTVQCNEPAKSLPNDSYRELRSLEKANYYIANRVLKFSMQNAYNIEKLNYTILDVSNGMKPVKHIPVVKLVIGLNKIDLDLTDLELEPGKHYYLKVYPYNENPVSVRFVYEDKDEE